MAAICADDETLIGYAERVIAHTRMGTIPWMAVDANGDISATTTTSGVSRKMPGRVGDSPIIGAGCCVDNEVGAAGSTGKGEENIKICGGDKDIQKIGKGEGAGDAGVGSFGRSGPPQ